MTVSEEPTTDQQRPRIAAKELVDLLNAEGFVLNRAFFAHAVFEEDVSFDGVTFTGTSDFRHAQFRGEASFLNARFEGMAQFEDARFDKGAAFDGAQFGDNAVFSATRVEGRLGFEGVAFGKVAWLGPLLADEVDLEGARFVGHAEIIAQTGLVQARRARFDDAAIFRLRYAILGLEGANFGMSSSIAGSDHNFRIDRNRSLMARNEPPRSSWMPRLVSLRDSDVGNLVITDVDLRWCQFAGARRLDKLSIEGRCPLNSPPGWPWARRAVLAEEHFWRARKQNFKPAWQAAHPLGEPTSEVGPARLAGLYRSLRKAFEDGKNEAGAGDFYYGEMEARRHAPTTPLGERWILAVYWALSGYGQRAWRAFGALVVLLVIVSGVLVGWGLPQAAEQQIVGTVQSGQAVLAVREPATVLPPGGERVTGARVGKSAQTTLGAMVFRDAGQKLTQVGVWTVMVARIGGPLLLALAVLAIRARVKR